MIVERKNNLKQNKMEITITTHLQEKIKNANITYFILQIFLKNKNISKKPKLRLKNTIIDKKLTYASETSMLSKRNRNQKTFLKGMCLKEF
jgi:hypothetical protein